MGERASSGWPPLNDRRLSRVPADLIFRSLCEPFEGSSAGESERSGAECGASSAMDRRVPCGQSCETELVLVELLSDFIDGAGLSGSYGVGARDREGPASIG